MVKEGGKKKRKHWRCQVEYVRKLGKGKLQKRTCLCKTSKAEKSKPEINMLLCCE